VFFHNSKNTKRLKAVTKRIEKGGDFNVEVMSEAELASERAALASADNHESGGQFLA
jgi:hypothetical protein